MLGIPIPDKCFFFLDLHNITATIKAVNVDIKQIIAFDIVPLKKAFTVRKTEAKSIMTVQK